MSKGLMGISVLIIFIAIILVASIAASVILTTGNSMQQKALITSAGTEENVVSGMEAMQLMGHDASASGTPHKVTDFELMLRLKAGSIGVNFENVVLTVDTEVDSTERNYNSTVATDDPVSGTSQYWVTYVKEAFAHEDGYLNRGDIAKIIFHVDPAIQENQHVKLKLIPRIGQTTEVEFYTGETMTASTITFWPN